MKDTVILLLFLLSVLGLILGIYYTEDISSENSHDKFTKSVSEDSNGVETITLEKKEKSELSKYFT